MYYRTDFWAMGKKWGLHYRTSTLPQSWYGTVLAQPGIWASRFVGWREGESGGGVPVYDIRLYSTVQVLSEWGGYGSVFFIFFLLTFYLSITRQHSRSGQVTDVGGIIQRGTLPSSNCVAHLGQFPRLVSPPPLQPALPRNHAVSLDYDGRIRPWFPKVSEWCCKAWVLPTLCALVMCP